MQILFYTLIAGSLAALIASGLALVYGVLGVFNMALGQTVLAGGYTTWWLHQSLGLPLFPSILGGIAMGGLVAWFTHAVFVEPFKKHHRFLPIVTTIALGMMMDGLLLLIVEEKPRSILPGLKSTFDLWGARISPVHIVLILSTLVLLCSFAWVFHATSLGRRVRAVVQHPHAALSLGIRAPLLYRSLFIMSGIFAGAAGVFIGIDQSLTPILAFPLTIKAYAAVIAGGRGNVWGAVACAYLIAFLEQIVVTVHWFGVFYIPAGYQQTVALLFIIILLLIRPEGLFVSSARKA